jgi:hypothetical protein
MNIWIWPLDTLPEMISISSGGHYMHCGDRRPDTSLDESDHDFRL